MPDVAVLLHLSAAALICIASVPAVASTSYTDAQLWELQGHEAITLLCNRNLTARRYAEALIARIADYKCINAFAYYNDTQVLAEADAVDAKHASGKSIAPLCGFAFGVKDNIDVLGYPTGGGTPALEGMRPEIAAPFIDQLRAANGVVLGKMRMHELAADTTSINPEYGPVLNPYNNLYHVGGSSGGSGAAVAARMMAAALCTDTGGSCRIPGSLNGVVGFRPTTNSYNGSDGILPMTTTRDTAGIIARSAKDIIVFDKIMSIQERYYHPTMVVPGTRVGYPSGFWEALGSETTAAFDAAIESLKDAGAVIVPIDGQNLIDQFQATIGDLTLFAYEMPRELGRYLVTHNYDISLTKLIEKIASPSVKAWLEGMAAKPLYAYPSPEDYLVAVCQQRPAIIDLFVGLFDNNNVDLLVVPTTPITARPIYDTEPYAATNSTGVNLYSYTYDAYGATSMIDSTAAVPGLSIPIGLASNDLPIGIQFYARPGDDGRLLQFGSLVEDIFAATPAPPNTPACKGCTPKVTPVDIQIPEDMLAPYITASADPGSALPAVASWTLDFEGTCVIKSQYDFPQNGLYVVE